VKPFGALSSSWLGQRFLVSLDRNIVEQFVLHPSFTLQTHHSPAHFKRHQIDAGTGFVETDNPKEKSRFSSAPWVLQSANDTAVSTA
jgi:hypothetical protein